jgi:methyl-accepting chemotaxis protein
MAGVMNFLSSVRVGTRLAIGFGLLLFLLMVMTTISLNRMAMLDRNLTRIVEQDNAKKDTLNTMRDAVRFQAVAMRDVVMQEDLAFKRTELKLMKEARKKYNDTAEAMATRPQSETLQSMLAEVKAQEGKVQKIVEEILEFTLSDSHLEAANTVREKLRPNQIVLLEKLELAISQVNRESADSAEAAQEAYRAARSLTLALGGLALLLGFGAAFLIARSISRPLGDAVAQAKRIAGGDLTGRLPVLGRDEVSQLSAALNEMTEQLARLIDQVKRTSSEVGAASTHMSGEVNQAVVRVDLQNEKVMSISSALEQLTVAISEVAANASGVSDAAQTAHRIASSGAGVMEKSRHSTERIKLSVGDSTSSISELGRAIAQIANVTMVIREIADQTNLLALNAAIEAARAGEQGRGFAVVADEVRKLAERTTSSTADIAAIVDLIGNKSHLAIAAMDKVTAQVEEGAASLSGMQTLFNDIIESAEGLTRLAGGIADATKEQQVAANETASGMEIVATLTEENTATIHEFGSAVLRLDESAAELTRSIDQFRIR